MEVWVEHLGHSSRQSANFIMPLLHKARHFGIQLTWFYDKKHKTIPYPSCLIHIILEYNRQDAMVRTTIYSISLRISLCLNHIITTPSSLPLLPSLPTLPHYHLIFIPIPNLTTYNFTPQAHGKVHEYGKIIKAQNGHVKNPPSVPPLWGFAPNMQIRFEMGFMLVDMVYKSVIPT